MWVHCLLLFAIQCNHNILFYHKHFIGAISVPQTTCNICITVIWSILFAVETNLCLYNRSKLNSFAREPKINEKWHKFCSAVHLFIYPLLSNQGPLIIWMLFCCSQQFTILAFIELYTYISEKNLHTFAICVESTILWRMLAVFILIWNQQMWHQKWKMHGNEIASHINSLLVENCVSPDRQQFFVTLARMNQHINRICNTEWINIDKCMFGFEFPLVRSLRW